MWTTSAHVDKQPTRRKQRNILVRKRMQKPKYTHPKEGKRGHITRCSMMFVAGAYTTAAVTLLSACAGGSPFALLVMSRLGCAYAWLLMDDITGRTLDLWNS